MKLRIGIVIGLLMLPVTAPAQDGPCSQFANGDGSELRLYVGMWTAHFKDLGRGIDNNWLVGFSWSGYYGGTFVNSYGDRAFTLGIQRMIAESETGALQPALGWRLGLITGYDRRFSKYAAKSPVLPFGQVIGNLAVGQTGVEMGWTPLTASLGPSFDF